MSGGTTDDLLLQARQTHVDMYANVARLTLVSFDILLTLAREKQLVWDTKFRLSSVLYYIIRYPVILYQIFSVVYHPGMPQVCDTIAKVIFVPSFTVTIFGLIASFILRVYAVVPKGKVARAGILALLLLGLLAIILNILEVTTLRCDQSRDDRIPASRFCQYTYFVAISVTFVTFDIITVALTAWGLQTLVRTAGGWRRLRGQGIFTVIIRSGMLFFITVTVLQLIAIVLHFLPQGLYSTILDNLLSPLSAIFVARFLLDLRETAARPGGITSISTGTGDGHGTGISIVRDFDDRLDCYFDDDAADSQGDAHVPRPTGIELQIRISRHVRVVSR